MVDAFDSKSNISCRCGGSSPPKATINLSDMEHLFDKELDHSLILIP